jgi:hypothetical protein
VLQLDGFANILALFEKKWQKVRKANRGLRLAQRLKISLFWIIFIAAGPGALPKNDLAPWHVPQHPAVAAFNAAALAQADNPSNQLHELALASRIAASNGSAAGPVSANSSPAASRAAEIAALQQRLNGNPAAAAAAAAFLASAAAAASSSQGTKNTVANFITTQKIHKI